MQTRGTGGLAFSSGASCWLGRLVHHCPVTPSLLPTSEDDSSVSFFRQTGEKTLNEYLQAPGARADPQQRLATTSADMGFPFPFALSPTLHSLSTSLCPSLLDALPQSFSHPSLKHLHHSLQQTLVFLGISSLGNRFETLRP